MTKVDILLPRKNFDVIIKESFSDGITGIFGPSGSGKTSLMQSISGLAIPKKGHISIGDRTLFNSDDKTNIPVEKRNIGYVFQEGRLFPHMTVEKNLKYGVKKNRPNKVSFDEVVDLLNLRHLLKSKPMQISGGERQRTALGRSLLSSPDILLLDEPFSAVDSGLRLKILPFIIRIHKKTKIPILVVSHDLPDLLKLTNTLFIIRDGKCAGHGNYYDLLRNKSVSGILNRAGLINTIEMVVAQSDAQSGLTILTPRDSQRTAKIKCEKSKVAYNVGECLKIFINADDIALSAKRLEDITIQNQIEGTVTDIIERDSILICIVDVGFNMVVEITSDSRKRLHIEKGSKVWCLFKSVAIDVAST